MSCELDLGVQDVVERCWEELRLIRVYTKRYFSLLCPSSLSASPPFPHPKIELELNRANTPQPVRSPRFQRSLDRALERDDRRRVRSDPPDAKGDVQIRAGVGGECETCSATGWIGASGF